MSTDFDIMETGVGVGRRAFAGQLRLHSADGAAAATPRDRDQ